MAVTSGDSNHHAQVFWHGDLAIAVWPPTVEASLISRDGTLMLASRLTNETRQAQFFWQAVITSQASNSSVHSLNHARVILAATQENNG